MENNGENGTIFEVFSLKTEFVRGAAKQTDRRRHLLGLGGLAWSLYFGIGR